MIGSSRPSSSARAAATQSATAVPKHVTWATTGFTWQNCSRWVTDAGVQGVLSSLVEAGNLKQPTAPPGRYYDLTYLKLALAGMKH